MNVRSEPRSGRSRHGTDAAGFVFAVGLGIWIGTGHAPLVVRIIYVAGLACLVVHYGITWLRRRAAHSSARTERQN